MLMQMKKKGNKKLTRDSSKDKSASLCVCVRVFKNSLVYFQCYHPSPDVCQRKSSGTSTTSVLLSTEHLPCKYCHSQTHREPYTTAIIKLREGEPEERSR